MPREDPASVDFELSQRRAEPAAPKRKRKSRKKKRKVRALFPVSFQPR